MSQFAYFCEREERRKSLYGGKPRDVEIQRCITNGKDFYSVPIGISSIDPKLTPKKVINGEGRIFKSMTEAARYYNVNTSTIYLWDKSGKHGIKLIEGDGKRVTRPTRAIEHIETGKRYASIMDAVRASGWPQATVMAHCQCRVKNPVWRYVE